MDVGTPGFSSWSGCTDWYRFEAPRRGGVKLVRDNFVAPNSLFRSQKHVGCVLEAQSNESFPIFQALLNAAHRGVKVRLLTNDYGQAADYSQGLIDPLGWLSLNGVEVCRGGGVAALRLRPWRSRCLELCRVTCSV